MTYSVLKVPLNPNQPTRVSNDSTSAKVKHLSDDCALRHLQLRN